MKDNKKYNTYLITIGDELLLGQVVDTNSAWIADKLLETGYKVKRIVSIPDEEDEIINALKEAEKKASLIITTGGLGPTVDDITKRAFAKYLGVKMQFNRDFYEKVKEYVAKRGHILDDMLYNYSFFPEGTRFLTNNAGTAPGMLFEKNGTTVIALPGVPHEMKSIMKEEVLPLLHKKHKDFYIFKITILTAGEIEAAIADKLKDIVEQMPEYLSIAYLPNLGRVRIRLTATGKDKDKLKSELDRYAALIEERLGKLVFGHDDETLEAVIGKLLREKELYLGTAESCTGGNVGHKITSVPGSSNYYQGGIIAYSNDVKREILKVKKSTLDKYGAVSEQTVKEMVTGTINAIGCDVAIATTGIAGPTGSEHKPVGTIWIACGTKDNIITKKLQLGKNRLKNIETSTVLALDLLRYLL